MRMTSVKRLLGIPQHQIVDDKEKQELCMKAIKYRIAAATLVRDREMLVRLSQAREVVRHLFEPKVRRRRGHPCPKCGDDCQGTTCWKCFETISPRPRGGFKHGPWFKRKPGKKKSQPAPILEVAE